MKHTYADLMLQYAEDAQKSETPWEFWEYSEDQGNRWWDLTSHPKWHDKVIYRRKGTCITIANYEFPIPEVNPPKDRQVYYIPHLVNNYISHVWHNDRIDRICLYRGLVHLTAKAATLHTLALLSITKNE